VDDVARPAAPRAAVVTGAGSGLGRAIARALLADGWAVALLGRTRPSLEETADGAAAALVLPTDVADEEQVGAAFGAVRDTWGRLDLLSTTPAPSARPVRWTRSQSPTGGRPWTSTSPASSCAPAPRSG
jgi:NAD(P)-dependent dehydrogenase (short-subunit alcohol dehydrogenase family)